MLIKEFFELRAVKVKTVWSKRGDNITRKAVPVEPDLRTRTSINPVAKEKPNGE